MECVCFYFRGALTAVPINKQANAPDTQTPLLFLCAVFFFFLKTTTTTMASTSDFMATCDHIPRMTGRPIYHEMVLAPYPDVDLATGKQILPTSPYIRLTADKFYTLLKRIETLEAKVAELSDARAGRGVQPEAKDR
jgi:hypothetical protein